MSDRFPEFEVAGNLGRMIDDEIISSFGPNPNFRWRDGNNALMGPFAVLAYTPDLIQPYRELAHGVLNQKDFSARSRELACLAVTAVFDVPFVQYAHKRVGLTVGLSEAQVSSAAEGIVPSGLSEAETVVYATALALANTRGPLDRTVWEEAERVLGKTGAARVAQVVAWYIYNSMLLMLGDVKPPSN